MFWVAIIIVNIFGTLGYAEEEFVSTSAFIFHSASLTVLAASVVVVPQARRCRDFHHHWHR